MSAATRRWPLELLRWGVSLGAMGYVAWVVDWGAAQRAFARVSVGAFAAAVVVGFLGVVAATYRWRALLRAFGAVAPPGIGQLLRLNLRGLFYNVFLPGGVGGDVVRGFASRAAFGEAGATAGVAVVFVERVIGLAGLVVLAAAAALYGGAPQATKLWPLAIVLMLGAVGVVLLVAVGRRVAPRLPSALARWAERLPELTRPWAVVPAAVLSLGTQGASAVAGHVLLLSMTDGVTLATSLAVIPVAAAAAFFPFTVGGLGARETAFVFLYRAVGVPEEAALIASIGLWLSQAVIAGAGGLIELLSPLARRRSE